MERFSSRFLRITCRLPFRTGFGFAMVVSGLVLLLGSMIAIFWRQDEFPGRLWI